MATVQSDRYLIRYAIVVPYGDKRDALGRDVPAAVESWTARAPLGYRIEPGSGLAAGGVTRGRWVSGQAVLPPLTVTAARTHVTRSSSSVAVTVGYTPPGATVGRLADAVALHGLLVRALRRRVERLAESLDGVVTVAGR